MLSRLAKWGSALPFASLVAIGALGCAADQPASSASAPSPLAAAPIRVLMVTATAGFRHDSIAAARQVMGNLPAASAELAVTATEDLSTISTSGLRAYDVLMFALTTGELALSGDQRAALLAFVAAGGGFVGVHSATDTLYEWPEYGQLVGAYFKEHPWTQQGTVIVEDPAHPAMGGVADGFSVLEEFYTFRENPRPRLHVLLRLDAASVGSTGDYPLAWVQSYGSGRAYYNALGHFPETWRDPRFQRQLAGAIRWVARRS